MKRALVSHLVLLAVAAFVTVASPSGCGGSANDADADGGAAGNGAGGGAGQASGGTAGTAGGAIAGSTGTAGATTGTAGAAGGASGTAGATGGGASCNDLTVTGDFIPQTAGTGTAPTPTGGTIANGTYVLTKVEVFSPMTPSTALLKVTMKVTGKNLEWLSVTGTSAGNAESYTTEILGTNWVLTGTCPSAAITPATPPRFTASASGLLLYIAGQYQTYAKK